MSNARTLIKHSINKVKLIIMTNQMELSVARMWKWHRQNENTDYCTMTEPLKD